MKTSEMFYRMLRMMNTIDRCFYPAMLGTEAEIFATKDNHFCLYADLEGDFGYDVQRSAGGWNDPPEYDYHDVDGVVYVAVDAYHFEKDKFRIEVSVWSDRIFLRTDYRIIDGTEDARVFWEEMLLCIRRLKEGVEEYESEHNYKEYEEYASEHCW